MEKQEVVMPIEVFSKVINVLGSLPYKQVAGLMAEVNQTARQITKAEEDSSKKIKK